MSKQIVVVGDVMVDQYFHGIARRVSQEAPVPILEITKQEVRPGGAANVAANVRSLGRDVTLLSVVGNHDDIDVEFLGITNVLYDSDRNTTIKTRMVEQSHGQQMFRTDLETIRPLSKEMEDELLHLVEQTVVPGADALIISDYGKGVITPRVAREALALANERRVFSIVDPKQPLSMYRGADIITPNEKEFFANHAFDIDEVIGERSKILVTLGERGMEMYEFGKDLVHFEPHKAREVIDVTGAGDTVVAAIAVFMDGDQRNLIEAIRMANVSASIAVGKRGTSTVTKQEVFAALGVIIP